MKKIPNWVKGIIVGLVVIVCGSIVFSAITASSSLCGLNTSGPGVSHACTLPERFALFFVVLFTILIDPFTLTALNFAEYHSWKMLVETDDLFFIFLIHLGILVTSALLGYLYGKIKKRKFNSGVKI